MSLNTMNKNQLEAVAAFFEVPLVGSGNNKDRAATLLNRGVTDSKIESVDVAGASEFFGVDLGDASTHEERLGILAKDGVTYPEYRRFVVPDENEAEATTPVEEVVVVPVVEEEEPEGEVLLVMTRANPTFQVAGITFTKKHPFAIVSESKADYICQHFEGFRPALPAEVKEYYGTGVK